MVVEWRALIAAAQCKTLILNLLLSEMKAGARWHVFGVSSGVVFSILRLFPAPKHRAEVIELLASVQDLTRPEPGCIGCWLSEEDLPHNHVRYAEQWESDEALHAHIRSGLYHRLLAAMELSRQQPEVKFYYCSDVKGLELIEAARSSTQPVAGQP